MNGASLARRAWLRRVSAAAMAAPLVRIARALANGKLPSGIHDAQGTVTVSGRRAALGTPVAMGDSVSTGPDSRAVVVLHQDAVLLRANTVIEVRGHEGTLQHLLVATGKVLSVFSNKPLTIRAGQATIGIRGTGAYLEVGEADLYFCLCYGEAALDGPGMARKVVKTTHHDDPLLIETAGGIMSARPGAFRNHTDDELIMLEALVGREPPFLRDGKYSRGRY